MHSSIPRASIRAPTTIHIGPSIREFPVNAIRAAYESLSSSSPGPRYEAAVRTAPTSMKRNPNAGRAIWQFAAITTPATIRPPSIFSTLKREIGVGHFNFEPKPPLSIPSSVAIAPGLLVASMAKRDFSLWKGVPNVMTEQLDKLLRRSS